MLPYLSLPGPCELDETRLGRLKLSKNKLYCRKINRVMGLFCRQSGINVVYYVPDRKHATLTKVIRKHCAMSTSLISDTMSSYVRPKTESSRLD